MQVWVAVRSRRVSLPADLDDWIEDNEDAWLPFAGHVVRRDRWASASGRTAIHSWDNGQAVVECDIASGQTGSATTASGYLHHRGALISHQALDRQLANTSDASAEIGALGGVFAAVRADASDRISAWASRGRLQSIFYAVGPDLITVSNRPHVAHLVARQSCAADFDDDFAAELLASGLVAPCATPFRGVRQLADGARLEITPSGEVIEVEEERIPGPDAAGTIDDAAEALVAAIRVLSELEVDIESSLTGGKDSRLIACLLHEAGVPFSTVTTGADSHPDVVLAREVAAALGVTHRTAIPQGASDPETIDFDARISGALRGADAMLPAYDTPMAVFVPATRMVKLSGAGGEVLRGGLARVPDDDRDFLVRKLTWEMTVNSRYLRAQTAEHALSRVPVWMARCDHLPTPHVLSWYHRDIRLGRWNMGRMLQRTGQFDVQPFLDNQAIRTAMMLPIEERASERAFRSILDTINPAVAEMPLATSTWRFDTEKKRLAHAGPVYNWRLDLSGMAGSRLFARIDSSPSQDRIFSIVDKDAFERLRTNCEAGKNDGAQRPGMFLWGLATLCAMWDQDWNTPRPT